MLIVATILAIVFRIKENDIVYPLVFVWAFIGIGVQNLSNAPLVAYSAFFLATIVFVIAIFGKRKQLTFLYVR